MSINIKELSKRFHQEDKNIEAYVVQEHNKKVADEDVDIDIKDYQARKEALGYMLQGYQNNEVDFRIDGEYQEVE